MPIAIVGTGRSGTSMISRFLNLCGMDLGEHRHIYHADQTNEKGSWEHSGFNAINREVLSRIDTVSVGLPLGKPGWEDDASLEPLHAQARQLIARTFGDNPNWAWKMPQASITIPFWRRVTPDLKFVLCIRNPIDFAKSYGKYHGHSRSVSYNMWQYFNCAALRDTPQDKRFLTFYENYFPDYAGALAPLLEFAGLAMPEQGSPQDEEIGAFHTPDLKHHSSSLEDVLGSRSIPQYVKELYLQLLNGPSDGSDLPLMQQADMFMPMLHQFIIAQLAYEEETSTRGHVAELERTLVELSSQRIELAHHSEELEQILASRTHRLATKVCDLLIRFPVTRLLRRSSPVKFGYKPAPASEKQAAEV